MNLFEHYIVNRYVGIEHSTKHLDQKSHVARKGCEEELCDWSDSCNHLMYGIMWSVKTSHD